MRCRFSLQAIGSCIQRGVDLKKSFGKLPSGTLGGDKKYEELAASLLARSSIHISILPLNKSDGIWAPRSGRDILQYANMDFLMTSASNTTRRQLVFESNVAAIERDHINQLNRYMSDQLGRFGGASDPPFAESDNGRILWTYEGQRRCILVVTDQDLASMVTAYESKQRQPIEVLKKVYWTLSGDSLVTSRNTITVAQVKRCDQSIAQLNAGAGTGTFAKKAPETHR